MLHADAPALLLTLRPAGLEAMQGRIEHVKVALQEKINVLMRKQVRTAFRQQWLSPCRGEASGCGCCKDGARHCRPHVS